MRSDAYCRSTSRAYAVGELWAEKTLFPQALERCFELADSGAPHLVVTLNIAQVWQARRHAELREAYQLADLATPDGWPVAALLRSVGDRTAPVERVTGTDLMAAVCARPTSVAVIGGKADSAERAAEKLAERNTRLQIAAVEAAPSEDLSCPRKREEMLSRLSGSGAAFYFVGLGVPKQEKFALDLLARLERGVVFCVGAAVEFHAGTNRRAPALVRRLGLEWMHRLVCDPRKMLPRYLLSAVYFSGVVAATAVHRPIGARRRQRKAEQE